MRRWISLLLCTVLAACASAPPAPPPVAAGLLHDDAFAPPADLVTPAALFRLDDGMRRRLVEAPRTGGADGDPRQRLIDLLYRRQALTLQYDAYVTRTAAETYEAHAGNCLSLVIMTAAFAKAMGLPVEFRSVAVEESWTRSGDLYFAAGHVNLALGWPLPHGRFEGGMREPLIVDFLPSQDVRDLRVRRIGEATVVAMFMNNRAAEAMARGALDEAYGYAREALRQDPGFLAAYNTLGVVYLRKDRPDWAQPVFAAVLERDPGNTKVMGNQVQALRAGGRTGEADRLAERLAQIDPFPPYHFFRAGLEAMRRHDYGSARALFNKEAARQADNPEVHFWLARAEVGLGNLREAARELERAEENSNTQQDHAIYAAKLAWLRQRQQSE